jgi:hypothetical protein
MGQEVLNDGAMSCLDHSKEQRRDRRRGHLTTTSEVHRCKANATDKRSLARLHPEGQ